MLPSPADVPDSPRPATPTGLDTPGDVSGAGAPGPDALREEARSCGPDIRAALRLAARLSPVVEGLGSGGTGDYLATLAALGEGDLTAARVVEPHLDALAILRQAGLIGADGAPAPELAALGVTAESTWGVYAAHAPGLHLAATQVAERASDEPVWRLTGTKPWCSLPRHVSHAVITAHVGERTRRAFAVRLDDPGIAVEDTAWAARGLTAISTATLTLREVPAVPVGGDDWYLTRPGFAWGGIGVGAVWVGGARGVARALRAAAGRREPDQVALWHLGQADEFLWTADLALAEAARRIDAGSDDALLAPRVRAVAAHVAEEVMRLTGHALGPAPLTHDEEHARRVADLTVYVRQHHAERDLAALGREVLAERS